MNDLNTDQWTILRNIQSINEVPETHIHTLDRLALLKRTVNGEDVRAYGSLTSPTGILNCWDWDTRIPFYPLAQERWRIEAMARQANSTQWHIELASTDVPPLQKVVEVTIDRHPWEVNTDIAYSPYLHRGGRVCRMVAAYINLYQDDPAKYNGCHF